MEDIKPIVAKNIAALRTASGMTQIQLAEKLNYSDKAVSKWERGESLPDVAVLTQIADLGPGIKALVGFVGFVVALISLSALRNFGPVLFYVGLAIFGAVGLVIAGAIMGAVI